MNQVTNLRPAGALSTESQTMHALVLFMTGELLPDMIFNWPNGAKRIEDNLQGAAQSYARQLSGRGFTPALIRTALQVEIDGERDFMPTPRELASRCQELQGHQGKPEAKRVVSTAAIQMRAESQLYQDGRPITTNAVELATRELTVDLRGQGVEVVGGGW